MLIMMDCLRKVLKLISFSSLLLMVIGMSTACDLSSENKSSFYESTNSTSLGDEDIQSIALNSTETDVFNVFGEPDFKDEVESPKSMHYIYGKEQSRFDVDFLLMNDKVTRYHIGSTKYKTIRNITLNSPKEDIISAYGKNFYTRSDTGAEVIGYFDKVNDTNLEFGFSKNKVITIIYSYYTYSK